MTITRSLGRAAAGAAGAGAAGLLYAAAEARSPRVREIDLELGRARADVTVLHVSDTHMRRGSEWLVRWLEALPGRLGTVPDLVIATGDLIDDDSGIAPAVAALGSLEARLGLFYVLGSHDYYQSRLSSPARYWRRRSDLGRAIPAATSELEAGLKEQGWVPLTNGTAYIDHSGGRIRLAGTDDPYIHRHDTTHLGRASDEVLAIAVFHAPDIVSECALAGFDLILAGHTHGGQVRIPGIGAVVTNCTLPAALASGPSRVGRAWLHVSPGLSTSRFTPIRFACRPEATLLRLRPDAPAPP